MGESVAREESRDATTDGQVRPGLALSQ
jgi:hypothetical protein